MTQFKKYAKSQLAEMRPYVNGENTDDIVIRPDDLAKGSPKQGDMIARNPKNHTDQWLVSEKFFKENYIEVRDA